MALESPAVSLLVGVISVVVLLVVNSLVNHHLRRRAYLRIQHGYMSRNEIYFLDLPKRARNLLLDEADRQRSVKTEPPGGFPAGYGQRGTPYEGVNFQSAVLNSVSVIEHRAKVVDSAIKTKPPEKASTFLQRIQARFPGITDELIISYLSIYERCLDPDLEVPVSTAEYQEFVGIIVAICHELKD
ncbi:hypothetical protein NDN08_006767 [Rhodosorus marinus]|uniref:Defect at low temperature protein 1 n=1 Tax=Rhodosorus marinus TaxID=101924 RepID=A0AAV8UIJ9_9RHOD|nr:hypothetical protein NDN08_006767 [Rhodosorus marinus]